MEGCDEMPISTAPLEKSECSDEEQQQRSPQVTFNLLEKKTPFNFKREKNNTTSSLYIRDTITTPNVDEVLRW